MADSNWQRWFDAAARTQVDAALRGLYEQLESDIARQSPTCWLSGRCCNFDAFDHRLYVTALEIAWVLRKVGPRAIDPAGACAYQENKMCSIHGVRPLGCRIFFCQQGTQQWQYELYERYLAKLRELHEQHDLPYRYVEWREGLQDAIESNQAPVSSGSTCDG